MPPPLAARMTATLDQISKGRFGLNIVSGWQPAEYRSDFAGKYFTMKDCQLSPRPAGRIDMVCAGQSERGLAPRDLLQMWKDEFDYLYDRIGTGLASATMHPQVIGPAHRMLILEQFIEHVQDKPGVHFTTMRDYCRKWREGKTPCLPIEAAPP